MNPNNKKPNDEPDVLMAPEDSPRLQEIEALEAREIDAHPKPFDPESLKTHPRPVTSPVPVAPKPVQPKPAAPPIVPKVVEPVKPLKPTTPPAPTPTPKPAAPAAAPAPAKPAVKKTPAAAMAEELANAPPTRFYQFFHHQNGVTNRQRVAIVAGSSVAVLFGLGILLYSFVQ